MLIGADDKLAQKLVAQGVEVVAVEAGIAAVAEVRLCTIEEDDRSQQRKVE